jgi:uncharacterized protein YceK
MKKLVFLMIVGIVLMGCATVEFEFDPTPTKFDGEWRNAYEKYNDSVYVFSGNRWKYTCNDESKWGSGYFTFTNDRITLYMENGKKWWSYSNPKYKINDAYLRIDLNDKNWFVMLKQPVEEFVTSGEMFDKIQGTWRFPVTKDYIYTFSGNHFSYSDSSNNKNNYEGTFAITNNGLLKLLRKEETIYLFYSFPTNESIRLDYILSQFTVWTGTFNRQ